MAAFRHFLTVRGLFLSRCEQTAQQRGLQGFDALKPASQKCRCALIFQRFSVIPEPLQNRVPGENPEAPPVADEARDSSEKTRSDAKRSKRAARLCFRGAKQVLLPLPKNRNRRKAVSVFEITRLIVLLLWSRDHTVYLRNADADMLSAMGEKAFPNLGKIPRKSTADPRYGNEGFATNSPDAFTEWRRRKQQCFPSTDAKRIPERRFGNPDL